MLYPLSYRGWDGSGYRTAPWPHRRVSAGLMGSAPPEDPCVNQRSVQGQGLPRDPLGVHVVFGAQAEAGGVH